MWIEPNSDFQLSFNDRAEINRRIAKASLVLKGRRRRAFSQR